MPHDKRNGTLRSEKGEDKKGSRSYNHKLFSIWVYLNNCLSKIFNKSNIPANLKIDISVMW